MQERLGARREEVEAAVLTRVYAVSDPSQAQDPTYLEGLRATVAAALDYGLAIIESSEQSPPEIPPILLVQARVAARERVRLDMVLRRYFAGYTLFGDFLIEEADALSGPELKRLLRTQTTAFDRLLEAVSEEYAREGELRALTREDRKARLIEGLLAGERLDVAELSYGLEGHHVGIVAVGSGIEGKMRKLAGELDRRLLLLDRKEDHVWGWLGGRQAFDAKNLHALASSPPPDGAALSIGEPGEGVEGWRLTHRQARAALPIARRGRERCVRYADVAVVASGAQDELLVTSLRKMLIEPLGADRDGGETLRQTLRAYFASERNLTAAAATLGVSRQAVGKRLAAAERYLGRSLESCAHSLELALVLEELGIPAGAPGAGKSHEPLL